MLCFEYDHQIPTLKRLITLTNRSNWTPEEIGWDRPLSKRGGEYEPVLEWHGIYRNEYIQSLTPKQRERLAQQYVAFEFSQILHGEQAALMLAGQLTSSVNDLDARIFAANQARDEARHVQAVRELVQRIGPIYPCGPVLEPMLEDLLQCGVWPKQVLGLQLFLEARALLSFRQTLMFVRDPVFRDVTTKIERDEAHHVAFGIQYLKTGIEELSAEELEMVKSYVRFLNDNVWDMTAPEEFRAAFEEADLDYDECFQTQPMSFSAPIITPGKAETVDAMHHQFSRWFTGAVNRVGLGDALGPKGGEAPPEEPESLESELSLPWLEPQTPVP